MKGAAGEAVEWLSTIMDSERPPATRYHFDGRDDWRNHATFTFDLAMVCRGLHAIRHVVPEHARSIASMNILSRALLTGDGLPVYINRQRDLPDRWSTSPGPYQLKAAAALLSVLDHPALWKTYEVWKSRAVTAMKPEEVHGALNAVEGLVQFGLFGRSEALPNAAHCFEVRFSDSAPWTRDPRSDVIAQAIRLGCVLRSFGFLPDHRWQDWLSDLRLLLEDFIDGSGRVSFRPSGHRPLHYNAWSAIFTYQALYYYERFIQGIEKNSVQLQSSASWYT